MNYFELPMPFDRERIDSLLAVNKELTKSRIDAMYNGISTRSANLGFFQQERVEDSSASSLETLFPYVERVFENGVKFIFLLNGTKIPTDEEFSRSQESLYNAVKKLVDFGITDFRVANTLTAEFLSRNFDGINLRASTSFEFQTVRQYIHLVEAYPKFSDVVPSYEHNHNFRLLEAIKKALPDVDIELMVNEGCISGCPFRNSHNMMSIVSPQAHGYYYDYCKKNCIALYTHSLVEGIFKSNLVLPWQIYRYNAIGVNHFKLVGRNSSEFLSGEYDLYYKAYLYGVEDLKNIEDMPALIFSNYFVGAKRFHDIKVKDVLEYFPDIEYFYKNGHLCASDCGVRCNYCKQKADNFLRCYARSIS